MASADVRVPSNPQSFSGATRGAPQDPWCDIPIDLLCSACWKRPGAAVEVNPFVPVRPIQLWVLLPFCSVIFLNFAFSERVGTPFSKVLLLGWVWSDIWTKHPASEQGKIHTPTETSGQMPGDFLQPQLSAILHRLTS